MTLATLPHFARVTRRLFALLVLMTIVPAAFVLWFMNAAVTAESESARQRVREAYRGQLRLVRVWTRCGVPTSPGSPRPARRTSGSSAW